jgi:hypothetical protein
METSEVSRIVEIEWLLHLSRSPVKIVKKKKAISVVNIRSCVWLLFCIVSVSEIYYIIESKTEREKRTFSFLKTIPQKIKIQERDHS